MDTSLLSFSEQFSATYVGVDSDGLSSPEDNNRGYFEWEDERELNGDIGLIPESSSFLESLNDMPDITNSLPSLDIQKISEWPNYIFVDDRLHEELPDPVHEQDANQKSDTSNDLNNTFDGKDVDNFDLTKYINEQSPVKIQRRVSKGKRIDMDAQRYIIEEENAKELDTSDEIDVETVSDETSLPVLEANDAFSLLEQFEASEQPNLHHNKSNDGFSNTFSMDSFVSLEMQVNLIPTTTPVEIFAKVPKAPVEIFEDVKNLVPVKNEPVTPNESITLPVKNTKPETKAFNGRKEDVKKEVKEVKVKREKKLSETKLKKEKAVVKIEEKKTKQETKNVEEIKQEPVLHKPQTSDSTTSVRNNKQIREALPQELIKRINESGKRKPITVIPPIPNTKKRGAPRPLDSISQIRNKVQKTSVCNSVQLDHDYSKPSTSSTPSLYPKEPKKDSGFQSAEEEDRSVLRNQPTVKTADGKVMVSLLKVNTIRNNDKKKLNLEEYRKRKCISSTPSLNTSPISSTCSSPVPEDINLRRKLHEEKLRKMASEVLKTTPKSAQSNITPKTIVAAVKFQAQPLALAPKLPPGVGSKTYANIAVNTDLSSKNCIISMIESQQKFKELKPLLEKASHKINSNSLLTAVLEAIPKTKSTALVRIKNTTEQSEDKVVHYFSEKNTKKVQTRTIHTQTDFDIDEVEVLVEGAASPGVLCGESDRRGDDSPGAFSSSGESEIGRRSSRCSSTASSRHSYNSRKFSSAASYSSRSSLSRSCSQSPRSLSPKRPRRDSVECRDEVDERRVIYVGGLERDTKKDDLRKRFGRFGPITDVKVHFRDVGVNYGFVTFAHQSDAFRAIDYGNHNAYPHYDICFGGRRKFCRNEYSDLDDMREDEFVGYKRSKPEVVDYASLLKEHQQARRS